jgi:uncharacterized protein (TIGR00645 family)
MGVPDPVATILGRNIISHGIPGLKGQRQSYSRVFCQGWKIYTMLHQSSGGTPLEALLERTMYAARWLLAPVYLGLSLALILLGIKFFVEVIHVFPLILDISEADLVLVILSLIDMALVGGLIVMVMFSGYENFVSRLNSVDTTNGLEWLGKMDSGSLKNKVAASIVAISSIHLLQIFMNAQNVQNDKIMWYVILHLTFVLSAFCMGFLDQVTKKNMPSDRAITHK